MKFEESSINKTDLKEILDLYYTIKCKNLTKDEDIEKFKEAIDILIEYIDGKNYFPLNIIGRRPLEKYVKLSIVVREYFESIINKMSKEEKRNYLVKKYSMPRDGGLSNELLSENYKIKIIDSFLFDGIVDLIKKKDIHLDKSVRESMAPKNSQDILDKIAIIEKDLQQRIEQKLIEENLIDLKGELEFCHTYWSVKKRILKEDYGIEWFSPAECNPTAKYY